LGDELTEWEAEGKAGYGLLRIPDIQASHPSSTTAMAKPSRIRRLQGLNRSILHHNVGVMMTRTQISMDREMLGPILGDLVAGHRSGGVRAGG